VGVGAEIAGALIGRRNREGILTCDSLEGAFIAAEEEELVFLDRPAPGGAGDGVEILRGVAAQVGALEIILRPEYVVVVVDETGAVEFIGSRFGGHVDRRAAGQPLL